MKTAAEQLGGRGTSLFLVRNNKEFIKLLQSLHEGLRRCVTGMWSQQTSDAENRKRSSELWWEG